ncbi:MAG: DUF5681 domain-containing protein [Allgaiera sp.]|jgi:hypothetical protein|nr:DUF5681 domain-containing protein [Allgaiera sp.]
MEEDTEQNQLPKTPDYEIGYGRPPKSGQFKKGESGNRKGRPKGARGLKTDLKAELRERVTITENGRERKLTKQQLVIKQLVTKAVKGDHRAAARVTELAIALIGAEDEVAAKAGLAADDTEILAAYVRRAAGAGTGGDQDEP